MRPTKIATAKLEPRRRWLSLQLLIKLTQQLDLLPSWVQVPVSCPPGTLLYPNGERADNTVHSRLASAR